MQPKITPLYALRTGRKLSLKAVGDEVSANKSTISRVERGIVRCGPDLASRLVEFFGRAFITEEQIVYPERFMAAPKRAGR